MYVLRNHLGPLSHVLAGLLPLAWHATLTSSRPHPGLVLLCAVFALLPDIDSATSHVGRLVPPLSREIERRWGHRTITHSLTVAAPIVAAVTRLLYPDGWLFLSAAYGSHLLVDMIVGETGLPLLWPASWHFYFATFPPAGTAEAAITGLLLTGCLLPVFWPATAQSTAAIVPQPPPPTLAPTPTPTPSPTPRLVTIRIQHVYDPSAEILVQPGDVITAGHLLADLVTYRRLTAPTPTPTDQPTSTPTPTPTPRPTPTGQPVALQATALAADLAQAEARYRRAVAPPTPDPARIVTLEAQATVVAGGIQDRRDNLYHCQQQGDCSHWTHEVAAQELATLEAQAPLIATALHEARFPPGPDPLAIAIAQADYEAAQADYELRLAALDLATPMPTPTATLTPTPTPLATKTGLAPAAPVATIDPAGWHPELAEGDQTRVRSLVAGRVVAVEISNVTGNEATVEIVIELE